MQPRSGPYLTKLEPKRVKKEVTKRETMGSSTLLGSNLATWVAERRADFKGWMTSGISPRRRSRSRSR